VTIGFEAMMEEPQTTGMHLLLYKVLALQSQYEERCTVPAIRQQMIDETL
jgi:hypothetical protein